MPQPPDKYLTNLHLPDHLIERLKTDGMLESDQPTHDGFIQYWGRVRYEIIFGMVPRHILLKGRILDPLIPCTTTQSWLGVITLKMDVGGVYEAVRLGISVNQLDADGVSPLALACGMMLATPPQCPDTPKLLHIARILIEQHAEVNVTFNGESLLVIACKTGNWELIELLVLHGACAQPCDLATPSSFLPRKKFARDRFAALHAASPRPPRKCPCWSGNDLDQCHRHGESLSSMFHSAATPYPPDFYCLCQSGKPYRTCCLKRRAIYEEVWFEDEDRLTGKYLRPFPPPMSGELPPVETLDTPITVGGLKRPAFAELYRTTRPSCTLGPMDLEFRRVTAISLIMKDALDPAFVFALQESRGLDQYIAPV